MKKHLITDAEVKVISEVKKLILLVQEGRANLLKQSKASIPLQSVRLAYRPLCRLVLGDISTF